ncbi:MAG: B12-binding domain-containing protein [Planctomycetota bacterium]
MPNDLQRQPSSNTVDAEQLGKALAEGRSGDCSRVVLSSYLSGKGIAEICEQVLAPATHQLGDLWTCGSIEVFQERRACEIIGHLLYELRRLLPVPPGDAPRAVGGSPSGDNYRLATIMVEMTLLDAGWRATSLGNDLPLSTLRDAAEQHRPRLLWLSMTSPFGRGDEPVEDAHRQLRDFAERLPAETHLVLGGRSAPDFGGDPPPTTSVCGSLAQLLALMPSLLGDSDLPA